MLLKHSKKILAIHLTRDKFITMKDMKLMKEKTKPFIFFMSFMVKNNLLLSVYFQVSRLKFVAHIIISYTDKLTYITNKRDLIHND